MKLVTSVLVFTKLMKKQNVDLYLPILTKYRNPDQEGVGGMGPDYIFLCLSFVMPIALLYTVFSIFVWLFFIIFSIVFTHQN